MAVSLQEFVAIFISVLYNLCKRYLGNRPFRVDIKHAFGHVNLERGISGEDFLKMLLENVGTFQKTSAYLGIKVIDETPATLLLSCPIFLFKWESKDIADVIQLHLLDIKLSLIHI